MECRSTRLIIALGLLIFLTGRCSARTCSVLGTVLTSSCSYPNKELRLKTSGGAVTMLSQQVSVATCDGCGNLCKAAAQCVSFNYHSLSKLCSLYGSNQRAVANMLTDSVGMSYGEANCLCNNAMLTYDCAKYNNQRLQTTAGAIASGTVKGNVISCADCGTLCNDDVTCKSFIYQAAAKQCTLLAVNAQSAGYVVAAATGYVFSEALCAASSKPQCPLGKTSTFTQQSGNKLEPVSVGKFLSVLDAGAATIAACENNCRISARCSSVNFQTAAISTNRCWKNPVNSKVTADASLRAMSGWIYSEETCPNSSSASGSMVTVWALLVAVSGSIVWHAAY